MTAEQPGSGQSAQLLKQCCAVAYEGEWARLLLGESFHPGGTDLTLRLGRLMGLGPSSTVLDVACGRGTSAVALAARFGCRVVGVDLSAANIEAAQAAATSAHLDHLLEFRVGDAEQLPQATHSVDSVLCECAFCTFPDKPTAAREIARVLRPGGVVGIADLTRDSELPEELDSLLGWVACVADARPLEDYIGVLESAGLRMQHHEAHDDALRDLVRQVHLTLLGAEVAVKLGKLALPLAGIETGQRLAQLVLDAVEDRALGYALLVARTPAGT